MSEVYVIRHGETDGQRGVCIGRTDVPLSERGRERAAVMGEWLKENGYHFQRIISSPLQRCRDTADVIARILGSSCETDDGLQEIDLGEWDGKPFAQIRAKDPDAYEARGKDPWNYRISGAETFAEAAQRFAGRIRAYAQEEKPVLVIAHKGVITALLAETGAIEKGSILGISCPNLSLSVFGSDGQHLTTVGCPYRPLCLLDEELISRLYCRHETPPQVQAHMKAVADFAIKLLQELPDRYDSERLYKAAILHDLDRTQPHHARVSAVSLRKEGFPEIADLVEGHHAEEYDPAAELTEADLLWYADKRVLEDRIVSLEERFAASLEKCRTDEARMHHERRYEKAKWIEARIEEERKS